MRQNLASKHSQLRQKNDTENDAQKYPVTDDSHSKKGKRALNDDT